MREENMPNNMLKVKMLGGFSLQYAGREIVPDRNTVSKTMQLLQMILLHAKDGVAKTSLIDALYGREDVENKNGSLNNTIFRLRKQLKAQGLPESSYITIQGGVCQWDEAIPAEVDCCQFEDMVLRGQKEQDETLKMKIYEEACRLYTGEFLPNMIGEDWAAVQNVYYRNLYFTCLEELCEWLKGEERFEEIYELTSAASEIYPFEEWQIHRIDSLIAMGRYKEAMDIYETTTKLFFDELSLPPSPEMLKRFRFMSERISQSAGAIGDIKHRLEEKERLKGAYYCSFPSFVDIYHVISRMMERNGVSVYIMLCTLKDSKGPIYGERDKDKEISELLQEAIRSSLRRGDFYTRYNAGQYLVMLSGINQENCSKVSKRIDGAFRKLVRRTEYKVDYYVASVAEISPEEETEERHFKDSGSIWKNG